MQYLRRHKLKLLITFILIIILGAFFLTFRSYVISNTLKIESKLKLSSYKATTSLEYGEVKYLMSSAYTYNDIKWSFASSNQNIGITVLIMDYINYQKFQINDSTVDYYVLSNGQRYNDNGFFSIPYNDYWAIVFLNLDPDQEETIITLSIERVLNRWTFFIIPSIVTFSLISIFIIIHFISKKLKKESYAYCPIFYIVIFYVFYMSVVFM